MGTAARIDAELTVLVPEPFVLRTGALEAGLDPVELIHQEAMKTRRYARRIVEAAGTDPASPVIEVGRPVLRSALSRATRQGCSTLVARGNPGPLGTIARLRLPDGGPELLLVPHRGG